MTNPPLSMKGTLDDARNMYDDETAEALHQVNHNILVIIIILFFIINII